MKRTIAIEIENDETGISDTLELPAKWEICLACQGEGTELYGSLKGADVTDLCNEDPDFEEEYHDGLYDVPCSCCHGEGKVLVVDESSLTTDQAKSYHAYCEYRAECRRQKVIDDFTRRQENGGCDR